MNAAQSVTPSVAETTTFSTPAGSPSDWRIPAKASALSGASDEGRNTTLQPAANAAATPRAGTASGKFHGVITRHGPTGRRMTTIRLAPSGDCCTEPAIRTASSAHHSRYSAANMTSSCDSARGLPISSVISIARRSLARTIASADRRSTRARSRGAHADQLGSAVAAAVSASSASRSPASGTSQSAWPVAGSSTVSIRPERAARQSPATSSRRGHQATASHSVTVAASPVSWGSSARKLASRRSTTAALISLPLRTTRPIRRWEL